MRAESTGDRTLALFLLGLALFTPPLLAVFSIDGRWLGIPALYLYIFLAWSGLILLMGLSARRGGERSPGRPPLPRELPARPEDR
jgi:hypothetical protein